MGSSELEVINEIRTAAESLTLWFQNNCVKVNPDKFHLLLSNKKIHQVDICNEKLSSTYSEKLLGKKTWRNCAKKPVKKSVRWQEFHL